ncbi:MAG TPA: SpoIIE family protein phosphatase [Pyrinomonadaceae bacterium]|nr:SpoIIE family protein phosphatase [Pyrinomonadaceae bacterium]
MGSAQMQTMTAAAGFDSMLHEQLLDRRQRLESARTQIGRHDDISRLLGEVDAALLKFESGAFGVCIDCHDPIEPERLLTDPLMTVCIGCLTDKQRSSLEDDLQLAADIQRGLLPKSGIACDHWNVDFAYHPAGIVSGDYVDIIERGDEFFFILGDVSGKGMAASLLMSNLHAIFHSLVPTGMPLDELMSRANHLLCESSLANQYATLVLGKANRQGEVEVTNAGHLAPVLIKNGMIGELNHSGLPLGMFCSAEFEVNKVQLDRGDSLLLFTDGVTETMNVDGAEYGTCGLFEAIELATDTTPSGRIKHSLLHIDGFRGSAARHDDLTILALAYN